MGSLVSAPDPDLSGHREVDSMYLEDIADAVEVGPPPAHLNPEKVHRSKRPHRKNGDTPSTLLKWTYGEDDGSTFVSVRDPCLSRNLPP